MGIQLGTGTDNERHIFQSGEKICAYEGMVSNKRTVTLHFVTSSWCDDLIDVELYSNVLYFSVLTTSFEILNRV